MISAITNPGKMHFMFYKETMSAQKLIEFMERIIRSNERKVFLILDNLRVNHSKALNEFLSENAAFIRLFYHPSYSPDLNPDEYLNRDLKSNLNNQPLGRAKGRIEEYARDHMGKLSDAPGRVARLFHAESVKYARSIQGSKYERLYNKKLIFKKQKKGKEQERTELPKNHLSSLKIKTAGRFTLAEFHPVPS